MKAIEEILREIRELAKEIQGNSISNAYELLMGLADRIEAAVKYQFRDVTKIETTTSTCKDSLQVGDMAAMRDALKAILDETNRSVYCIDDIRHWAEAALSAPPRNCDLYETEPERQSAFIAYYNETFELTGTFDEISSCELKHDVDGILHEYIDWLFAEAKGESK